MKHFTKNTICKNAQIKTLRVFIFRTKTEQTLKTQGLTAEHIMLTTC